MTNIEKLRTAIIESVPEIKNSEIFTPIPCPENRPGCLVAHGTFSYRPITLADVLRAVGDNDWEMRLSKPYVLMISNGRDGQWDLTKNLDDQSPETIDFLASVLCK